LAIDHRITSRRSVTVLNGDQRGVFLSHPADTFIGMYSVGEKPGKGRYCCTNCNWSVVLDDASDQLPPCGNCGKGQYTKYTRC